MVNQSFDVERMSASSSITDAVLTSDTSQREALREVLFEIAEALTATTGGPREASPALAGGAGSRALFYHYLGTVTGRDDFINLAWQYAHTCADALSDVTLSPSLYGGVAGIGWLIQHLQSRENHPTYDLADVDDAMLAALDGDAGRGFDLINGVVGIGTYFLERCPLRSAEHGLSRVVSILESTAEGDASTATWRAGPQLLVADQRPTYPLGRYDLGIAHGTAGVVAFLASAVINSTRVEAARSLLRRAVGWFQVRRFERMSVFSYPHWFAPGAEEGAKTTRAAWCYGDPGVGFALWKAGCALEDVSLQEFAEQVILRALGRTMPEAAVVDAPLCHGAAGLAYIAQRFARERGTDASQATDERWWRHVLQLRRVGRGVAGFESFAGGQDGWCPDGSFLTGAAGIGLAIIAQLHPDHHTWDRLLLMS
ncbi:MAG TPA: lanthionine synthetase C family protein [Gemmatimonadaceae bacterium]|jgi:lantibiotic modifying enzyme